MNLALTDEKDYRRLTVIFTSGGDESLAFKHSDDGAVRTLFVDTRSVVDDTLLLLHDDIDIDRIIIDRSISAPEFLRLLAALPAEFQGDVALVQEDGAAFISAAGRGAGRVMYALNASDTLFYLLANGVLDNGERVKVLLESGEEPLAMRLISRAVA